MIALSGWGQPHDALREIAPMAAHVDWSAAGTVDGAMELLRVYAGARIVIGWSMGGMLSALAVARGILKPQHLLLIASPYQFVQTKEFSHGMGQLTFAQYRENLVKNPERTLQKSYALIAYRDTRAQEVEPHLVDAKARLPQRDWLHWLDAMAAHSFHGVDLRHFPPVHIVHGENDAVIGVEQAHHFQRALPKATVDIWSGCGHAPHWHDAPGLRKIVEALA